MRWISIALVCACNTPSAPDAGTDSDAGGEDAGAPVDRGPTLLPIEGDANGLWWDATERTLYIADDNGNRILRWTDDAGFSLVADLTGESTGLGQLVRTADGTIVVTRFGGGGAGDVAYVSPDGTAHAVTGLDPMRRRIGLTVTPDGRLFDTYFVRVASGDRVGSVAELDLDGTEVEVIGGLVKPVGVLAVGDTMFVSDQDLGQILTAPLATPMTYEVHASELELPDLITPGPDGSLFMGGEAGTVFRIDASGETSIVASGLLGARGVAYDAENRRLFVAEHDPDETDGVSHAIRIYPIE